MDMEEYKIRRIPENYENGIHISGFTFKPVFLIEGSLLGAGLGFLAFFLLRLAGLTDIGQIIGIALVFAGSGFFLGVKGINDEPLTTYLRNLRSFQRRRRTTLYNPRIKKEARPYCMNGENESIPRERILNVLNKYKDSFDEKQRKKAEKQAAERLENESAIVFEDDIGIIVEDEKTVSKRNKENRRKRKRVENFKKKLDEE